MNKFFVGRYRDSLSRDALLSRVSERLFPELPFHIGRLHVFDFAEDRILLVSGEATVSAVKDTHHVYVSGSDFLVFDGCPVFEGQNVKTPWAKRLFDFYCRVGRGRFFEEVSGDYCVVVKRGDEVSAFSDFCGMSPVFYLNANGMTGISNRQRLLQRMLLDRISLDAESCAWMTGQLNVFGEQSIYQGVHLVSPSRFLSISQGVPTTGGFARYYQAGSKAKGLSPDDVQEATDGVIEQCRFYAELPFEKLQMDLTGGMDSRAVLAASVASGLVDKVSSIRTYGPPNSPEFEVPEDITSALGLPFEKVISSPSKGPVAEHIWEQVRRNTAILDGVVSPEIVANPFRDMTPCLSGTGGELYRPHIHARRNQTFASREEVLVMAENYQRTTDPIAINKDSTNVGLKMRMRRIADWYLSMGADPDDVHCLIYAEHRMPWWAGYTQANVMGRRRLFPLVNRRSAKVMYSVDPIHKKIDRLHFEIMKRADVRLLTIPFLQNTWDRRLQPYSPVELPSTPHRIRSGEDGSSVGFNWMVEFAKTDWSKMFDYILSGDNSVIFDFVDRGKFLDRRREKEKWQTRPAAIMSILSLVGLRMAEIDDFVPVKIGKAGAMEICTNVPVFRSRLHAAE